MAQSGCRDPTFLHFFQNILLYYDMEKKAYHAKMLWWFFFVRIIKKCLMIVLRGHKTVPSPTLKTHSLLMKNEKPLHQWKPRLNSI
jgi:hypothetical protein